MKMNKRKVAIVGCGNVGTTIAYTLTLKDLVDEILLIDINEEKVDAEKLDIMQGFSFASEKVKIKVGKYRECRDADIVILAVGALDLQKSKNRLDFVARDSKLAIEVTKKIVASGFDGIFLVVSNPVDVITYVVKKISKFPANRVIGTGTMLDTARLKFFLSEYTNISTNSIQTYVMGEHGNSLVPIWSKCNIAGKQIFEYIEANNLNLNDLNDIYLKTRNSGYDIANKKGATYYGISMCVVNLVKAIYGAENVVYPVSAYLNGEYGQKSVCVGVPAIINRSGIGKIIELNLTRTEKSKFEASVRLLQNIQKTIEFKEK